VSCRLVVITEIIAPYRIPVFNALALQSGIDLHVIFLAETDPTQRQWLVYKDEIQFAFQVLPSWRQRIHGHHLLLNWGMNAALQRLSPDVIVCGGYNYLASWEALRWAHCNAVPFLLWVESTARDFRSGATLLESLKTKFLRHCQGFVVAGTSASHYINSYDMSATPIFTAPNAVDIRFFAKAAEKARRNASRNRQQFNLPDRYFLFVGRLERGKGIFDLLDAYASLPAELRSQLGLVFVGDGSARSQLQKRAAAVKPDSIHIAGFLQREQLAIFYALAETFVFPTHTDPWGLVVNEAMSCGLPVVCSNAAGCAADLVTNRHNGRLFAAGDISQLACTLEELARSPEIRSSMGQASKLRIQDYSPEACAAGMAKAAFAFIQPQHACS